MGEEGRQFQSSLHLTDIGGEWKISDFTMETHSASIREVSFCNLEAIKGHTV